ncbi:hypothetical protein Zmor_020291 [Zophobas morio]|uniref:Uncharacterized protein n=1 Tax=Zophobas morio TaxID=2755281 RepID=A0AA38I6J3_9CUCU|nr:hypothetical protein Zmor_020291 [Zophobas morio]
MILEDNMANAILAAVNKMSERLNSLLLWSKQAERRIKKLEQRRGEESSSSEEEGEDEEEEEEEEDEVEDEAMEVGHPEIGGPFPACPPG